MDTLFAEHMLNIALPLLLISFAPPLYLYLKSQNTPLAMPNKEIDTDSKFTLLLPVRNEIKNIERKIKEISSLFQGRETKLIVIDSRSTDSTPIKAKEILSSIDDPLEWEIIETNTLGKSRAINHVLDLIETKWFIMFDTDSSVNEQSVNLILEWSKDPRCGAVCGSQKISSSYSPYRSRFNIIRSAETFHDSATVFEGALCAVRLDALRGEKLKENINADDTQFAHMVRRNGYRAIFESRAFFTDNEPLDLQYSLKRNIRRSQGLIRTLWSNKDLISIRSKYGRYYAHSFYFYIIFPWLVLISSFMIVNDLSHMIHSFSRESSIFASLFLIFIFLNHSFFSTFLNGLFSLIIAQISLIFGLKYNVWMPHRK